MFYFWSKKSGGGRLLGDDPCRIVKHQIHVTHRWSCTSQLVLPGIGALLGHVNRASLVPYKVIGSKDQNTGSAVPFLWLMSHLYGCPHSPSRL